MDERGFEVRPLGSGDVGAAAALQRLVFPAVAARPADEVAAKLRALYLESPYCGEGLSTVSMNEEGICVGFRGVLMRCWRLRGMPQIASTGTGVSVHPVMRRRGVAHAMVEHSRAQIRTRGLHYDFHIADRPAGSPTALSYGASNGDEHLYAYGFRWTRVLRSGLRERLEARLRGIQKPPALEPGSLATRPLDPASLADTLAALGAERPIHLDPDPDALRWLLAYMADYPSRGRLEARVVFAEGAPVGFFTGYLNAGGFEVNGFGATRDLEAVVLARMLFEAQALGARRAVGSATAWNLRLLLELGARIVPGSPLAFRESTEEVRQMFRAGESLLTGLEGEAWI